jgi:hypothetical protein
LFLLCMWLLKSEQNLRKNNYYITKSLHFLFSRLNRVTFEMLLIGAIFRMFYQHVCTKVPIQFIFINLILLSFRKKVRQYIFVTFISLVSATKYENTSKQIIFLFDTVRV